MKLLPTFAIKEKQEEEQLRKILRAQEINDLARRTDAELARTQADFNTALAQNRAKWALEEEEHAQRVKDMTQEIDALERRKTDALTPLKLYKDEADKLLADAKDIVTRATQKEAQADYLQEKLEEKLSEVEDRENDLRKREQEYEIARSGLELQRQQFQVQISRVE